MPGTIVKQASLVPTVMRHLVHKEKLTNGEYIIVMKEKTIGISQWRH